LEWLVKKETLQDEIWLTIGQAAERLGVHPTTLRRWADEGDIPIMITPGGHRRFSVTDIDRFKDERHRLRVVAGLEKIWAEHALTRARAEVVSNREKELLLPFDEQEREHKRLLGRRMMGLLLQYVSIGEGGEGILEEARAIGREHAENALNLGLPVSDALRVSMFFRDAVLEAALDLPEKAHVHTGANLELVRRINTLLNVVQLAITERYDLEIDR
jgi:excisionase family DNA binding protein